MLRPLFMALAAAGVLAACEARVAVPEPIAPAAAVVETATCDAPIGGDFDLPADTAVEAAAGYAAQVAQLDLTSLPAQLDVGSAGILHRALIAYMLERSLAELPAFLKRDDLLKDATMGHAILAAYAESARQDIPGPDLVMLRRGLFRWYQCRRAFPMSLSGFRTAIYDFEPLSWVALASSAKNETRHIREDAAAGVYVSETIVAGEVRETEILLEGYRPDGALDFLVYDAAGRLSDRSRFVTDQGVDISGAAPYVCVVCHLNPANFHVDVVAPNRDNLSR